METRLGLKKQGSGYLWAAIVALVATLVLPPDANAVSLTIDDIIVQHFEDGILVNTDVLAGTADATFDGSTLRITLTNTSSASTGFDGATNILTGIAFNLPIGMSIDSGSVSMGGGATAINFDAGEVNISSQWGFDNNPINGPFVDPDLTDATVNTSVATMASSTTDPFALGATSLDGPNFGLLSGDVDVPASTAGGLSAIQDSIVITLNLSGSFSGNLIDFINNGDVVLSFGSPDVPEPGTILLLGSGLITLGFFGRRRLFSNNKN